MTCYRCGGPALDLRHAGFNPEALEAEGTCYYWLDCTYACNQPPPQFRDYSKEKFLNCWVWEEHRPGDRGA